MGTMHTTDKSKSNFNPLKLSRSTSLKAISAAAVLLATGAFTNSRAEQTASPAAGYRAADGSISYDNLTFSQFAELCHDTVKVREVAVKEKLEKNVNDLTEKVKTSMLKRNQADLFITDIQGYLKYKRALILKKDSPLPAKPELKPAARRYANIIDLEFSKIEKSYNADVSRLKKVTDKLISIANKLCSKYLAEDNAEAILFAEVVKTGELPSFSQGSKLTSTKVKELPEGTQTKKVTGGLIAFLPEGSYTYKQAQEVSKQYGGTLFCPLNKKDMENFLNLAPKKKRLWIDVARSTENGKDIFLTPEVKVFNPEEYGITVLPVQRQSPNAEYYLAIGTYGNFRPVTSDERSMGLIFFMPDK